MENNIPDKMGLMRAGGPVLTANCTRSPKEISDWVKGDCWCLLSEKKSSAFFDIEELWQSRQLTNLLWFWLPQIWELGMTLGFFPVTEVKRWPGSMPQLQNLTSLAVTRTEQGGSTYHFLGYKQEGHYRIFFSEAPSTERHLEQLCNQLLQ